MALTGYTSFSGKYEKRLRFYFQEPNPWGVVLKVDRIHPNSVSRGQGFPDWRARKSRGESVTTIMSGESYRQSASENGYALVKRNSSDKYLEGGRMLFQWAEYEYRGCLGLESTSLDDPGSIFISSVKNRVIQNVVQQIIAAQTSLRGLVAAGELGESLRMIRSRSRTLNGGILKYFNVVNNLRHNFRGRSLREFTKDLGDVYLEFRFGWLPLVSDIKAAANAVAKVKTYRMPRVNVRYGAKTSELSGQSSSTETNGPILLKKVRVVKSTYGCRIYGAVSSASFVGSVPVLDEFGIGFDEFVPTIWELIPYSFVIDYFTNIGAIVDAYSVNTLGVAWLNIGELKEYELTSTPELSVQAPPSGHSDVTKVLISGSPYVASRRRIYRDTFHIGDLTPSLEFRIPGLGMQWLNIAALVATGTRVQKALQTRFG